jgi:hypothetical protein
LTENQIYILRKRRHKDKEHNAQQMAKAAEGFDFTALKIEDEENEDDDDNSYDSYESRGDLCYDVETLRTVDATLIIPFKTTNVGRKKCLTNKAK